MTTHLITGGSGFVGNLLACKLHARGEKIRILDLLDTPGLPAGIEMIRADILDRARVEQAMQSVDVVHHNAALVPLTKSGALFWRVNVDGTQIVLDSARKAGVKFFIHVSSSAVFGIPTRCPITDDTPLAPIESYGLSKLEAELRVRQAMKEGFQCAIVRPRTIIGRGRLGIFKILYEWISEGRKVYVIGDGNNRFQFVHGGDLIEFLLLLSEQRKTGSYNVGAERFGTLREDLAALIRHAGTSSRVVSTPEKLAVGVLRTLDRLRLSPLGPWHYMTYQEPFYFDISRPMKELGWRPRYSNQEAFIESYDWFMAPHDAMDEQESRSTHRKAVRQGILWVLKHLS